MAAALSQEECSGHLYALTNCREFCLWLAMRANCLASVARFENMAIWAPSVHASEHTRLRPSQRFIERLELHRKRAGLTNRFCLVASAEAERMATAAEGRA